jgi:general secretion pathway protein D
VNRHFAVLVRVGYEGSTTHRFPLQTDRTEVKIKSPLRLIVAIVLGLSLAAWGSDVHPSVSCAAGGAAACKISPKDLKQAKTAFARAVKLQGSGRTAEAFDAFEEAAKLNPKNFDYLTAREVARQELVYKQIQTGNTALLAGRQIAALGSFGEALKLDPSNEFARERISDALQEWTPQQSSEKPRILADAGEIRVQPRNERHDFRFRGDSKELLKQVAGAYGVKVDLDDSVTSRRVHFDIDNVDFEAAMAAANSVTKTFWASVAEDRIIAAGNTPENHRQYDRMVVRTLYLPGVISEKQRNDVNGILRVLFDIRFVNTNLNSSTLTIRAPQGVVDAATTLLEKLDSDRPQVMIDMQLFEINHTFLRTMGLNLPAQFTMFNIPIGALAALGGQNIQDLINQLIANGGINQAGNTALSALIAQFQNQQQNSIFSHPFATFGNGLTLMGLDLPQISASLSLNESQVRTLEHVMLHASQGDSATFRAGERYPILNASFAPIFNSPQLSSVIQNNSFTAPFPSFNYEDLGLTLKAKPQIHGSGSVTLDLELELKALGAGTVNGIPIINNRAYKGVITVRDGEQAVVAGMVDNSEQKSVNGIPGFGQIPGLNRISGNNNKQTANNELLVVITPHIMRATGGDSSEVWLPFSKY